MKIEKKFIKNEMKLINKIAENVFLFFLGNLFKKKRKPLFFDYSTEIINEMLIDCFPITRASSW